MLAVIPARGGSKGVVNKNIRLLCGKPLIAYTIEAAIKSGVFEKIIVSTDSSTIADVAREYGVEVPFMRPEELSGDNVSSDDVVLHALEFYQGRGTSYASVCKLQPTSPLRDYKHIQEAHKLLKNKRLDYVVSVCECEHSPLWSGELDKEKWLDGFIKPDVKRVCRQMMPAYYRLNGAIYMGVTEQYRKNRSFLGKNGQAFIMGQEESIDIDSELDFYIAECIMKKLWGQN